MKSLLLSITFLFTITSFAQKDCEYSTNVTDSAGVYKSTKEYLIHERFFGNNKTAIYFSLINADGLLSLSIQLIQKDTEFIPAKCFDKNSKIYFQLTNGKIITMLGLEQETCGNSVRNENENARFVTGYFLFMKDSFEDLKNIPISFMRIKYSGDTEDYILKPELRSEFDNTTYFPENYFINFLKCVE